ncbi:bombyxin A-1 homolog [Melitaea cinxia]|uniref:bombyxin A-1 homolog n=1 Tax=Melitaea cinxia TaxID=113334 RepID=UPI001E27463A|nr:bombyxin A-1 homolog [Melitaea cinxia]
MFSAHFENRFRTANKMKTQAVLFLFAMSCLAGVTSQEVYCGRRLASALALLCDFNLIKRSENQLNMAQEDFNWPWIGAHSAHSLGRRKRQAASECCDKPCTVNELLSYCGN